MKKRKNIIKDAIKSIKQLMSIPKRLILFLLLILLTVYLHVKGYVSISIDKDQYFWILSSYIQGFSAFTGIIIASLTLGTIKTFKKRINILELEKVLFMPIITAIITILFSIVGLWFYKLFTGPSAISLIVSINSIAAIWCLVEIFMLISIFVFTD